MENDYRIEQFTLDQKDYCLLSDFIRTQFLNDDHPEGGTIFFTEENFKIMFGSPSSPNDTFIRAIHEETGEVVGFLGGIPRTIHYDDKEYKCMVTAYITVHWKHRRKKLATRMGDKLLDIALDNGYQVALSVLVPEDYGLDFEREFCKNRKLYIREAVDIKKFMIRIFDVNSLSGVIKLKTYEKWGLKLLQSLQKLKSAKTRLFHPDDGSCMYELMNDHIEKNDLSMLWKYNDFIWYINQPELLCVVFEGDDGKVNGFLSAFNMNIAGFGNSASIGCIDLVHIYRLSIKDAAELCKYFCKKASEKGWIGLQTPLIPYYNTKPFKKSKFVLFPKKMIIGMFSEIKNPFPEKIKSIYLDWR